MRTRKEKKTTLFFAVDTVALHPDFLLTVLIHFPWGYCPPRRMICVQHLADARTERHNPPFSVPELPGLAQTSVTTTLQESFLLCPVLPPSLPARFIYRGLSPVHFLTQFSTSFCFQGIQSKTSAHLSSQLENSSFSFKHTFSDLEISYFRCSCCTIILFSFTHL